MIPCVELFRIQVGQNKPEAKLSCLGQQADEMMLEFCIQCGVPPLELFLDSPALALLLARKISNDPQVNREEDVIRIAGKKDKKIMIYPILTADKLYQEGGEDAP